MKIGPKLVTVIELAVIGLMSLCAALAFSSSDTADLLREALTARFPVLIPFVTAIIFVSMVVVGALSITLAGQAGGGFTWLAILICLPALLSYNSLQVPQALGLDLTFSSKLTFWEALGTGMTIMTGYILLHFLSGLKHARRHSLKRGSWITDIEQVYKQSHFVLLLVMMAALVGAAIIVLLSRGIESLVLSSLERLPGNIILVGLGCLFIIAAYLYWLGTRRKPD